MPYGLEIRDANNNVTFSSDTAVGGVCLGLFSVPSWQQTILSFPEHDATRRGSAITPLLGLGPYGWTYDTALGYPRFTFPSQGLAQTVLLFLK